MQGILLCLQVSKTELYSSMIKFRIRLEFNLPTDYAGKKE